MKEVAVAKSDANGIELEALRPPPRKHELMNYRIRNMEIEDYAPIVSVVNEWWGREVSGLLPRLFFQHFADTSIVMENQERGEIVGFVIGFRSQSMKEEGYIHFSAVNPDYRKRGIGRRLYDHFFSIVSRPTIKCITSPINKVSIAFHTSIGFEIVEGDGVSDGVSVHTSYDGRGNDRVVFQRHNPYAS